MKKIILFSLLCLPLFFLAQTNKQHTPQQLKEKDLEIKAKQNLVDTENKDVVYVTREKYAELKRKGLITNQTVLQTTKPKITIIPPNSSNKKTLTSTPCDDIPYVGTPLTFPNISLVDDDATETISLPFGFCFYGVTYNACNISINGNIQFISNSTGFTAAGFPSTTVDMIAPFWADIDLNGIGQVLVDMSVPTRVVISWDSVGRYSALTDKYNSFQCVITDGTDPILPPGKNVGFYYKKMQWANSGASGFNGNQSTVGINAGNGIDYFLIGRFNQLGNIYDGPLGSPDGVAWLEGKRFYFNACPPLGSNVEPLSTLIGYCDTLKVCGNDTLYIKNTFLAPEAAQTVSITATAPSLGTSFSYSVSSNANGSNIYMIVDGGTAPAGYHTVTMSATDNGTPAQTSIQNFVVFVNQAALNNLDGNITISPSIGACPGGVVSASVNVVGGIPDSYLWNNNSTSSSTSFTTIVAADSLIYVSLTSGQCQKTIVGHININPVPVASISGNLSYCNGNASSTVLTATNTLNPSTQGPHTFAWSATSGTLSSTNTETTSVNGGVYTVTVTNQFGCASVATTTVVMNETPSYTLTSANAISGGSVYCVNQDTARISIDFGASSGPACGLGTGLCVSPNIISIGTGTTFNTNTSSPCVYGNFYKNERHQMLYTAAELLAAGATPGKLSSISFQVNSIMPVNTTGTSGSGTYIGTLPNYSIKMKCTSNTVLSSTFDGTGLTQVFLGDVTPVVGLNTHTFSQPYIWDGTSNIIVDICYTRTVSLASTYYTSNPVMPYTNVGSIKCVYFNSDGTLACGNPTGTTTNNRPDIKFGNCLAQQTGSQFNIVVTPTTGVVIPAAHDSIRIDLPSTPGITCYTVSLINPIGNCSKDTVICVQAIQGVTQGTLVADNYTVCPSQPVTLTAQGSLTSYTIQYTDDLGSQTSTVSPVTFNAPATVGAYTYTLLATGPCGGPLTAFTTTLNVIQGTTFGALTFSPDSVCPGSPVTITANGPILPTYTITYGTSTGTASVVGSSVSVTPTLTTYGFQTYTLTAEGACGGPVTDFVDSVKVYIGVTQATITASADTLCPGSPITLNYIGTLTNYTVTYNDATGIHTSTTVPVTYTPMAVSNPTFGYTTYTLTGVGPCSGPLTSFVDSVFIKQGVTQATITASADTLCPGSPITLNYTGTLASFTVTYTDATGIHTSTTVPVTYTPMAVTSPVFGYVTYSLTGQGFCSAPVTVFKDSVFIKQGVTQATITASADTLCPGSPITLNYTGTLASFTVTYTDATGIHTSTTVPVTYTPMAVTSPVFGYVTYSLTGQGFCSAPVTLFRDSVFIKQGVSTGTLSVSSSTLCPGSSVTLSALGTLASYTIAYVDANGNLQLSPNSPATFVASSIAAPVFGIHTYTLIAQGFCSALIAPFTNTVNVMQGITSATLTPTQSVVCIGSPITLNATGTSMVTYTIQYNNGAGVVSSNNAPVTFNTAIPGVNTYTLFAQGPCSALTNTYSATVTVDSKLNLSIAPMANITKCLNSSVTLTANVASSAAEPYTYNWSPAVGTNTNSTYSTSTPVTTTFVVTVNGTCANTATASVVVSNFANDINVMIIDSASVCANTELVLHTSTTGGNSPYSYSWTILPDVNSISALANLTTIAPGTQGTYNVMVVSTDNCGFSDFDTQLINVLPPCGIEIGNIITPNGDGANDFFKIKNLEFHPNSVLTIFDRWGRKVYENQNYANEWKAEGSNDGTYFYILDVPQDKAYNGFVQVLR